MNMKLSQETRGMLWVGGLAVLVGLTSYAAIRMQPSLATHGRLPTPFTLDLTRLADVDPQLNRYRQVLTIAVPLDEARGVAAGPGSRIYVAGGRKLLVYEATGQPLFSTDLQGDARCLAVGGPDHATPGRIYVGTTAGVEVISSNGTPQLIWPPPHTDARPSSIAVAEHDVFVTNATHRAVWRLDLSGHVVRTIGRSADVRDSTGFIVPSRCFDLVAGPGPLVHVVNPGMRRIETYSLDGQLEAVWGQAGSAIGEFFGCCNPAHLAVLPDGRFVTSEKGIPRIKVYSEGGRFECVVAGPKQLQVPAAALGDPRTADEPLTFDIAADEQGRVLVLDPRTKTVRVFQPTDSPGGV